MYSVGNIVIYTLYGIILLNNIDKEPVRVYYCCMVIVQNLIMNSTIPAQAGKQFAPAGASGEPSPRRF